MKPLFVPLKTCWYRAFERGEKTMEYRRYGPRWNEHTCIPGRPVVLSHGYSGARLCAVVRDFRRITPSRAPAVARALYGNVPIAAIHLSLCK